MVDEDCGKAVRSGLLVAALSSTGVDEVELDRAVALPDALGMPPAWPEGTAAPLQPGALAVSALTLGIAAALRARSTGGPAVERALADAALRSIAANAGAERLDAPALVRADIERVTERWMNPSGA